MLPDKSLFRDPENLRKLEQEPYNEIRGDVKFYITVIGLFLIGVVLYFVFEALRG